MILDKYENSKNILNTHLLRDDEVQIDYKSIQELYFIRYLLGLEYTIDQIRKEWSSIINGTAKAFEYDPEEQNVLFNTQYQKALKRGPLVNIQYECDLFQEEIDWLNSLSAPLWFRQYLFGIYVYYKSMKKKYSYVVYKSKWCSLILKKCDNQYQYKRKSDIINRWNRDCGLPMKLYPYDNTVYISFKEVKGKNLVAKNVTVDNFSNYFDLLEEKTFICTQCGAKMELNEHSKRTICPECYHKDLKKRNLLCKKKENNEK